MKKRSKTTMSLAAAMGTFALAAGSAQAALFADDFSNGATKDGWVERIQGASTFGYDGVATIVSASGQPSSLWHNFSDTVLQQGQTLILSFDVMMSRDSSPVNSGIRFGLGYSSSPLVDGANLTTPVDGYMSEAPFLGSNSDVRNAWLDGDPTGLNWGNAGTAFYTKGALDNNDLYTVSNTELRTVTYEISRSATDVLSAVTSVNGGVSTSVVLDDQIADFKFNAVGFMAAYNSGETFTYDNVTVVPEPAMMSLLAIGGVGLLLKRHRRV